jgi:hypothetical protein
MIDGVVSLLPRTTHGDLRFLTTDAAEADIAVGPCWPSRDCVAIYLRFCGAARACDERNQRQTRTTDCSNTFPWFERSHSGPSGFNPWRLEKGHCRALRLTPHSHGIGNRIDSEGRRVPRSGRSDGNRQQHEQPDRYDYRQQDTHGDRNRLPPMALGLSRLRVGDLRRPEAHPEVKLHEILAVTNAVHLHQPRCSWILYLGSALKPTVSNPIECLVTP